MDSRGHPFIAVAGSIATGKSGLVKRLATALDAVPLFEDVTQNPYFDLVSVDPKRWSFHSQVAFTADSLSRHIRSIDAGPAVQDRTVYETVDVFARLLTQIGYLSTIDYATLSEFEKCAAHLPRQPTRLIYLHAPAPVLLERIKARDRTAERHLDSAYLTRLGHFYEKFIDRWRRCPVLRIDTTKRDLRTPDALQGLLEELAA